MPSKFRIIFSRVILTLYRYLIVGKLKSVNKNVHIVGLIATVKRHGFIGITVILNRLGQIGLGLCLAVPKLSPSPKKTSLQQI